MENFEQNILSLIESYSGLAVNEAHRSFMRVYVKKRMERLGLSQAEFIRLVKSDESERTLLINEAAINETYFFREEQQFDFLREHYLPRHLLEHMIIWSAACSTGEEALSLYALSTSCGINTDVYATDIDTEALNVIQEGLYSTNSFRSDGKKYLPLLDKLGLRLDGMFELSDECKRHIHISYLNLSQMESLPVQKESVNIIFIRNVFIYFDMELRKKIIRTLADTLKPNGLLFLSVNEVASIECEEDVPLVKEHEGNVYYFRKVDLNTKKLMEEEKKHAKKEAAAQEKEHKSRESFAQKMKELENAPRQHLERPAPHTEPYVPLSTQKKSKEPAKKTDGLPQEVEDVYKKVLALIDKADYAAAQEALKSHTFRPEHTEHRLYMEALLANCTGDNKKALSLLEKASLLSPSFWPASFQLGMLQMRMGMKKEGKKTLTFCIKSLKDYIKEEKMCYNAIVEQFSPAYFLTLCENYVKL